VYLSLVHATSQKLVNLSPKPGIGKFGLSEPCHTEFSSNPNQTHLDKLINVLRITKATGK